MDNQINTGVGSLTGETFVRARHLMFRFVSPIFWFLLGGTFVYFWNPRAPTPPQAPRATTHTLTFLTKPEGLFCAQPETLPKVAILRIVDGDTAMVLWDDQPTALRYYGVNTTERGHPCYDEGTKRNRALSGGAVRLAFDERSRDAYGRLLAYVFTEEGLSVDAKLVAEGVGKAWKRDGRLRDRIVALEDQARADKTGCLWSEDQKKRPKRP
jgi:endonuclease YncB( thermonuclease family)